MSAVLDALGQPIADLYLPLADDAPLPAQGPVIVSLARWQKDAESLAAHGGGVAVALPNTVDVLTLDTALLARPMLVLDFPAFGDGRAYSQAERLRSRAGYTGKLRAAGAAIVLDKLAMLARCGFSEFALRADQDVARCSAQLAPTGKPLPYQPARDRNQAVFAARS